MAIAVENSGTGGWNQDVTIEITVNCSNPYLFVAVMPTNGFQSITYNSVEFTRKEAYSIAINQCRMCGIVPAQGTHDLVITDTGGGSAQGGLIWVLLSGVSGSNPVGASGSDSTYNTISVNITPLFNNSMTIEGQFAYSDAYTTDITEDYGQTQQQKIIGFSESDSRSMAVATEQQTTGATTVGATVTRVPSGNILLLDVVWEIADTNETGGGSFLPFL